MFDQYLLQDILPGVFILVSLMIFFAIIHRILNACALSDVLARTSNLTGKKSEISDFHGTFKMYL